MDKSTIETYFHPGEGYNPFFITGHWQVAQLNFLPGHEPENIRQLEVHHQTDEVFILVKGKALLIGVKSWVKDLVVECVQMEPGVTYNIPAGVWHNIAMGKTAELIIVEKSNTHIDDVVYRRLNEDEQHVLENAIREALW